LDLHDPDATARYRSAVDIDDEAGESVRPHLRSRPAAVRAIRYIEVRFRELRDLFPHPAAMADEQPQVAETRPTYRAARHRRADSDQGLPFSVSAAVNLI